MWLQGQDTLIYENKKGFVAIVDTLLIDKDINHWSMRAIASFKDNNFRLSNSNSTLHYTPTNRAGAGVGFASSKLLLDLTINIKTDQEESTERFDLQGNLLIKQELLLFQIQNYQGFNVINTSLEDPSEFREDIHSFSSSLNYTHLFKPGMKTPHTFYSNLNSQATRMGTFLAGVYTTYHYVYADSSIVPASSAEYFNEQAQIQKMHEIAIGVSGGYAYILPLPAHFFFMMVINPGLGLNFKSIKTETSSYRPSDLWELYLYANIAFGYNGSKFYLELRDENTWFYSSLGNENRGSMNSTKIKLAFGWKFRRNKKNTGS